MKKDDTAEPSRAWGAARDRDSLLERWLRPTSNSSRPAPKNAHAREQAIGDDEADEWFR